MKFKLLRKKDTKELVEILSFGSSFMMFVSETPTLLHTSATIEEIQKDYKENSVSEFEMDFTNLELVDVELFETNIGEDIRNKLSPFNTLLSLIRLIDNKNIDEEKKIHLRELLKKEMDLCKLNIEYLSNLL
jgi:hypothetical protein